MPYDLIGDVAPDADGWRRLHPATLVLRAVFFAQRLIVPAAIVFFLSRNDRWQYWLLIGFVPAVLFEVFRYFTLRYRLGADELIVRRGLIFRGERHVPFARIQNINLVQGVLHRLFGVADVTIETASGGEPEAVLKVLSTQAVAEMRRRVFRDRAVDVETRGQTPRSARSGPTDAVPSPAGTLGYESPEPRQLILSLKPGDLAILGLVTVRGLALVAVLVGLSYELDLWDRYNLGDWIEKQIRAGFGGIRGAAVALALLTAVPVLAILSIAWCFLRFYGYRLESGGDDLHISAGLLTRRSAVVPRHRIQFVTVRESLLHRLFGRATIRIETASGVGGDGTDGNEASNERLMAQRWFVPLVRRTDVAAVLLQVHPRLDLAGVTWTALPPRALGRMRKRNAVVAVLLSAPVAAYFWPWGLLATPTFLLIGWWHAGRAAVVTAYARTPFGMMFRSGVLGRYFSATFGDKVQVVSLRQSPLDRRHMMARLRLDTAGAGPAGHFIEIPFLPRDVATRLAHDLVREASPPTPSRLPTHQADSAFPAPAGA